jgi:hypothetical protein
MKLRGPPGLHRVFAGLPPSAFRKFIQVRPGALGSMTPSQMRQIMARLRVHGSLPKAQQVRVHGGRVTVMPAAPPLGAVQPPRVIGKGWMSVAVLPEGAVGGLAGNGGAAASAAGQAARSLAGNGGQVSNSAIVGALLHSARPVHGSWGSGRLVHTSLISMLITSNGHVLVGAVAPSVLYADAAQVK